MAEKKKEYLVIGAGAIGGTMAGILAREGYRVDLICKYPETALDIGRKGLKVKHPGGEFDIVLPAFPAISDLDQNKRYDYVLMATKAGDLAEAARAVLPHIHEDSRVVSLQNGICEELLAEVVGQQRTVGCTVGYGATMHSPGFVEMTSSGELVLGYLQGGEDRQLLELKEAFDRVVPAETTGNMMGALYSKLIINSCITTLGAASGQHLGKMLKTKEARELFIGVIREAMDVAGAMELEVPPYAGKLDYTRFLSGPAWKQHTFIKLFGLKYRKLKSSSLQSLERGKKTEIDYFNGYIASRGEALGVPTPLNSRLTEMIKSIETGLTPIAPENLSAV